MFDISCGDDGGPASCGIFGGSVGGGGAKQPQTLAGLLKKLDLSEYEPKFVAAGITDVRRSASRFPFRRIDHAHSRAGRLPRRVVRRGARQVRHAQTRETEAAAPPPERLGARRRRAAVLGA